MKGVGLIVGLGVVSAVAGFAILRYVADSPSAKGSGTPGKWAIADAASFEDYVVPWLGEEFEGLKLQGIVREIVDEDDDPTTQLPRRRDAFFLVYGDCTPKPDQGCAPPLSVHVQPRCYAPPELFPDYVKEGSPRTLASGVVTQYVSGHLRAWSGDVVISLFAPRDRAERALVALIPLNNSHYSSALSAPEKSPCNEIQGRSRAEVPLPGSGLPPARSERAPAGSPLAAGLTLFIDANGAVNGSCNPDDSAATVPLGAHAVQVCLAGNIGGNVDALDITVTYNDAREAGAPEVDCPGAGGGANCVDDNPNLNDGAAAGSQVGTGWSCTAFGTTQPKADASGPASGQGQAALSCNANVSSPNALLLNGLLATLSLNAIAAGTHTLAFGTNPVTGAPSGISRLGVGTASCGPGLTCTGATITVQ